MKIPTTDIEGCTFALVGEHTEQAKVPGAVSVFGLFPTEEGAKIYMDFVEKSFWTTMNVSIRKVGIKRLTIHK